MSIEIDEWRIAEIEPDFLDLLAIEQENEEARVTPQKQFVETPVIEQAEVDTDHAIDINPVRLFFAGRDTAWMSKAACKGTSRDNYDIFYIPTSKSLSAKVRDSMEDRAREICNGCDVRAECLDYALTHQEDYGIWGGKTADERNLLLNRYVSKRGRKRLTS